MNALFKKLQGINNRCGKIDPLPKFDKRPMFEFMDRNDGRGRVLIFMDEPNLVKEETVEGIYFGPKHVDRKNVVRNPFLLCQRHRCGLTFCVVGGDS